MLNPLKQKILERIDIEGPINFEQFMEMALYYPGLGYYAKDSTDIGKAGDFYTSPHLHSAFGAMLGKQMEEIWDILGNPDTFDVVEMGAGVGYLAKDMLGYLRKTSSSDLFNHIRYWIIELNPFLKKRQQEILSEFGDCISWITSIDELEPIVGTFLSNELLDSFPVRLIETSFDKAGEIFVSREGDNLVEIVYPLSNELKAYLEEFSIELPPFYRTEANLRIKDWLKELSKKIKEGFIITIDYGYTKDDYYSEERNRGTLLCYYKHQVREDPYKNIGEQDITAHVNFSSLKKWAEEIGFKTLGFCPQGTYLLSLGINELISQSDYDFFEVAKIKGLLLPLGMGQSHHVMVHYKGDKSPELRGFRMRNRLKYL